METLPFITMPRNDSSEMKHILWEAALQLNNLLTIPMKLLKIDTVASADGYALYVEACADREEWKTVVDSFVVGFNTQIKMQRLSWRKIYEKTEKGSTGKS